MNIALDATPLTIGTGGVRRYTWELARALAQNFPDDQYWLLSDQPFTFPDAGPANLLAGSPPSSPVERRWWLWGLKQEMIRRGIELFHGTDFSVPYLKPCPTVLTLHDLSPWMDRTWQPDARRVRRRTPRLLRWGFATMVITPSEAVRRAAIERFGLDGGRVVAVPLAAGAEFTPSPSSAAVPTYFLFVATLEPRKNFSRLLEAWRVVRGECDVELVVVGRVRSDFQAPAPEPGLRMMGAVPDGDLPRLYSGATACIYPSLYEGFGLPVLEAMQCGAAVITSRDPAICELTGGSAAIHVEAVDVRGLAEAMLAAVRTPERFNDIRARALARAAQFTWKKTAERTREVYVAARRRFEL